ncbi:MAG: BamA/TamA family outer membrane protein [Bacteroidia bacterium]|nr:BamA/TamA family outer membrane protein [Bacteroidia bacterium]
MKKILFSVFIYFSLLLVVVAQGQNDTASIKKNNDERGKIKTGWNFGALPVIAYNSDIGFMYGGLVNFFHYGDGSIYPKYLHSIYIEISRTTKGGGINKIKYDSEHLLPSIRITGELGYYTEKALDFYGFNGYEADYEPALANPGSPEYITRMYYRYERKLIRFTTNLRGKIYEKGLRWIAGVACDDVKIRTVDIERLNKGKSPDKILPDTITLYDRYVEWGIITDEEKNGGTVNMLKAGLVYDTRDNEPNPISGIWSEAFFLTAPSFLGSKNYSFTKLIITHRQYFTLVNTKLSFAYRLMYQGTISGKPAFYMQPYIFTTTYTFDGLGGAKSLRGTLRDRVAGDGFIFGNFEFRAKFLHTRLLNQNFYLTLSPFIDAGKVVQRHKFNRQNIPAAYTINEMNDGFHINYGCGLYIIMNENFIISVNYGRTIDAQDGTSGLYIDMNFLF